ncbi:hypothetical protein FLAN108750_13465 [Flavobacterium antarcticum]|uniref:hypothetical protein n=1 Tax=Flavobacterium antarcticum TaxID=271155 RepID=UPI00058DF8AB|nr:hypothetical protein [Flavobacterium antarcticum]
MKYILTRDVLISECKWLQRDFLKGEILYLYEGATYNCISKRGFPFTESLESSPFFEIPQNAVTTLRYDMDGNPIGPFEEI